jgi:CPA2 family monovalent cation:H+ antiporter-2
MVYLAAADISLITTIAFGLTAALIFGILAKKLGLSPIVGYLLGGIAVGPHTPGFAGNIHLAEQLAEIGVILLMFGVGLHFRLGDLLAVRSLALPGAVGQSAVATAGMAALAVALGWSWPHGIVLGLATAVASTVVLLRVLMDNHRLETPAGHVAVGWLVVEDVMTVLVLVMLPTFAAAFEGGTDVETVFATAGLAVLKLGVLAALVMLGGSRIVPWLLNEVARLRSRELFTLTVLVLALAIATLSYLVFGASMALGAFLAGMVVGQSKLSHQAAADALPLRDAFAVLFFVSVGMLFDFWALWDHMGLVLAVLGVVMIVKPLVAFAIVMLIRPSLSTALLVSVALAQIGEFSFILAKSASDFGLMPEAGTQALVAGAIVSITLNPLVFGWAMALEPRLAAIPIFRRWVARAEAQARQAASDLPQHADGTHAVIIGYGPVGRTVRRILDDFDMTATVIEMNVDTVNQIVQEGGRAVFGDATKDEILLKAGVHSAFYLVVTVPDPVVREQVVHRALEINPEIRLMARTRFVTENEGLEGCGVAAVACEEVEVAVSLAEALLRDMSTPLDRLEAELAAIRCSLSASAGAGDAMAHSTPKTG